MCRRGKIKDGKLTATNIKNLNSYINPNVDRFVTRPISNLLEISWPKSYYYRFKGDDYSWYDRNKINLDFQLHAGKYSDVHMTKPYNSIDNYPLNNTNAVDARWMIHYDKYDNGTTDKWDSATNTRIARKVWLRNTDYVEGVNRCYVEALGLKSDGLFWGKNIRDYDPDNPQPRAEDLEFVLCDLFMPVKKDYTCINENWSIGVNQVYTADADLILKDGVTLTVPEGAVLCVKDGAFFVNGIIDCYGTILVEDGGVILPYQASGEGGRGSYIKLRKGGSMIIEEGGRVYAGCPEGQLGTANDGWLDMYQGSTLVNFGLLVAGNCDFNLSGSGSGTIENHPGGAMFLGYTVDDPTKFMGVTYDASRTKAETLANALGLKTTGGRVAYAYTGGITTFMETWEGSVMATANNKDNRTVKIYAHDKDYKYTEKTYTPN